MWLCRNAVRIVTGRASRLRGDDVFVVTGKTLVGEDASAAVAFVAEVVVHDVLNVEISQSQVAFQDRHIGGTVWPFCASATGARSLVVVVAIGAVNLTTSGHWCEE